jgi:hypothetical protein
MSDFSPLLPREVGILCDLRADPPFGTGGIEGLPGMVYEVRPLIRCIVDEIR